MPRHDPLRILRLRRLAQEPVAVRTRLEDADLGAARSIESLGLRSVLAAPFTVSGDVRLLAAAAADTVGRFRDLTGTSGSSGEKGAY